MRILLSIWFVIASCIAAEEKQPPTFENLTIVVSSCDKFSEFWPPFFTLLFKQWPSLQTENVNVPLLLISNQKSYPNTRVTTYQVGPDKSWSDNMLRVLKEVKTDYVLYLQEDYFFNTPVNEQRLFELLKAMESEGAAYVQLGDDGTFRDQPAHPSLQGGVIKEKHTAWRASLQAALWRKDVFEWLIKSQEDPWKFEFYGSLRSQGIMRPFWAVIDDFPLTYLNACEKGFWINNVLDYIKSQGIDIPERTLPDDKNNWLSYWVTCFWAYYPNLMQGLIHFLITVMTIFVTAFATYRFCKKN